MTDTDDENIKETRFNLSIFSGFILIGFVVIALFSSLSEDGTSGPASSSLWGYSIILFSLIGIVFVKIKMIEKDENKSVLSYVIGNGLPIFLLLFNLLWLISLNVTSSSSQFCILSISMNWSYDRLSYIPFLALAGLKFFTLN